METLLVVNYVVSYKNCYCCNIGFWIYSSDKTSDLFELVFHPADEHGQREYVLCICEHVMKPMNAPESWLTCFKISYSPSFFL